MIKHSTVGQITCKVRSILWIALYVIWPSPAFLTKIEVLSIMSDEKEYYVVECEEEYEDEECQITIDDYLYSLSSNTADEEDVRQVLLEF